MFTHLEISKCHTTASSAVVLINFQVVFLPNKMYARKRSLAGSADQIATLYDGDTWKE